MTAGAVQSSTETAAPHAPVLEGLAGHSRFVQRVRRRYWRQLSLLAPGEPTRVSMIDGLHTLRGQGHDLAVALRILRQLVVERLVVLDCEQHVTLEVVTRTMTELAQLALDEACHEAFAQLDARHGEPLTPSGERARLWVMGMGKLGARELNVSSDIDLVYIYDQDGQTAGRADGGGRVSVEEYFMRVARVMHLLIGNVTEHGFVFRIDLGLRPNGNAGAVVSSLASLQEYMRVQGREWERFAWMKSRVVAPAQTVTDGSARALGRVVTPFVFREYLDYGVYESLRALRQRIREHANRRSAGRPGRASDVKLSRGGIRELEFVAQLLQVVRGGQYPELRTRATLKALQRVSAAGLMSLDVADALSRAYVFLRRIEHRIQYLDDQQTHMLPMRDADLQWIAQTMRCDDVTDLLDKLNRHRETVAIEFDQLLGGAAPTCGSCPPVTSEAAGATAPSPVTTETAANAAVLGRLSQWPDSERAQALAPEQRALVQRLFERSVLWLHEGQVSAEGVARFADWVDAVLWHPNCLALLQETPSAQRLLLQLLGAARWPGRYLRRQPEVIDELTNPKLLQARFDADALELELEQRRGALARGDEADEQALMELLRRAHHAELFRTLVRDVQARITVEEVADDLSALADAILRVAMRWCWPLVARRHRETPQMNVIAYGKLGGKELGYGGDLDLVFVFDDDDDRAMTVYTAFARKLIWWMTFRGRSGDLYEIDTALRPNGAGGLLVTPFTAFADYQTRRGSNAAWTWEHQAMTRARMVPPRSPASHGPLPPKGADPALGRPGGGSVPPRSPASHGPLPPDSMVVGSSEEGVFDLTDRFDVVRHAVLTAARDLEALREQIWHMRQRIRQAHPVRAGRFDIKHSPGGMVDAEFVTQYLVLAYTREHPELEPNLGNIALLQRAEDVGLLPSGVGRAAGDAYRSLRYVQHRARLDELPTQVPLQELSDERQAIVALWQAVFEA